MLSRSLLYNVFSSNILLHMPAASNINGFSCRSPISMLIIGFSHITASSKNIEDMPHTRSAAFKTEKLSVSLSHTASIRLLLYSAWQAFHFSASSLGCGLIIRRTFFFISGRILVICRYSAVNIVISLYPKYKCCISPES